MTRFIVTFLIFASLVSFIILVNDILTPFVAAIILAYILSPLLNMKYITKLKREYISLMLVLLMISFIVVLFVTIIPYIFQQFAMLLARVPEYLLFFKEKTLPFITTWVENLDPSLAGKLKENIISQFEMILITLTSYASNVLRSGVAIFNLFSTLILVPIILFYLLIDWYKLSAGMFKLIPIKYQAYFRELLKQVDYVLANYVKGQLLVSFIQGIFYGVVLSLYGLENGFIIGLLSGFATIIPYFGAFLAGMFAVLVGYFKEPTLMTIISIFSIYAVGQLIESNFLAPKILGKKVGLNPIWMLFAMMVGAHLFGFVGIVLAIPVAAVIGVVIKYNLALYHQSSLYLDQN
ncbi:AI-2E family transporter [Rickettsiales endosymbiont of Stachyamoeba lipophora]|uniref:AI-2E family transporter n=1 Tax=Rickettsiales endosymbiont of Stachyamoeba lipophora TaxID=2486578 RepID=UPI000F654072|nr:AI-2E family transporter [Rickettsiales endosymbiont of Stachyamoeba lipophora]AZL16186.1 AI-2E family transporter [Rickettsiales endosymbiont of Stachyamoeba lipophora]